tara:strand:+ start:82 stop:195 length:114 start_codon:yes stop_codon:yes gene_type:complete
MVGKLLEWDLNHATNMERKISLDQNKNSGIKQLMPYS